MLSDTELQRLQQVTTELTRPVRMVIHGQDSGSHFENNLRNIARQINGVSLNKIQSELRDEASELLLPYLALVNDNKECVFYHAAPEGGQFEPFLDLITWFGSAGKSVGGQQGSAGGTSGDNDSELLLFIASGCPHCPTMVRVCSMILRNNPNMVLRIVDALYFTDWAALYKVKSTPTLVVDDGLTLVGNLSFEELSSKILPIDDPDFATNILRTMTNAGRAEDAGRWICKHKSAAAILPLYRSPVFAQRMGALVAIEEALKQDPTILDDIVDDLIVLLSDEDDGLRGDTADILGNVGATRAIPALERLLHDANDDVRDAAEEALGKLKSAD